MTFKIEIDYELADKITLQNLKTAYESYQKDIASFKDKQIQTWQLEDLDYAEEMCLALEKVIRYYLADWEAERYFNAE
jgi:hypothetical protein